MELTSKERVLTALQHKEPDRVPIFAYFTPEVREKLTHYLGMKIEFAGGPWGDAEAEVELGSRLGNDLFIIWVGISSSFYASEAETYVCDWGITWRWKSFEGGKYTEMVKHPLADYSLQELKRWKPPNPQDDKLYAEAKRLIPKLSRRYAIFAGVGPTIFEPAWYLRGMSQLLEDMKLNKAFVHELMDKIMHFYLVAGKRLIELGVDVVFTGDDVSMQSGMMISPELWREFIKPRYARLFEEFKRINPKIKIAYHSDGDPAVIIPEMIDIGMDILNPVQPECMDLAWLKKEYGHHLSFWGGLGLQQAFAFGSPEDIVRDVRDRVRTMAKGGGLIIGPTHAIQPDTSIEKVFAMYKAVKKYGVYRREKGEKVYV